MNAALDYDANLSENSIVNYLVYPRFSELRVVGSGAKMEQFGFTFLSIIS